MKKKNYPGMDGFDSGMANGAELLVMHQAFKSVFDDENDYIPEDGELDEDKDTRRGERRFD